MIKVKSFLDFVNHFKSNEVCREYLEEVMWDNKPKCPHCDTEEPYKLNDHKTYKCRNKECRKKFNVLTKTIFENSNIPLPKWFAAIYLITSHKKGISSIQLSKDIGVTQKSAWFVLQRIRELLNSEILTPLSNIIEVDETYVGGKRRNDKNMVGKGHQGRSTKSKTPIIGMLERKGKVKTKVVSDVGSKTIDDLLNDNVAPNSTVMTDGWRGYKKVHKNHNHLVIDHSSGVYVMGDIHINTIEGFWSLLKRSIIGIYHKVSVKHLHRYCNEFEFRYNLRDQTEMNRFIMALKQPTKRLRYKELIS